MERKRSNDGFFWTLFSAGGVVAAFLLPINVLLFGLAFPLGLVPAPSYAKLAALTSLPLVKLALFVMCSLPLFHWAHRFRFTLYDGLQIKHITEVIFVFCYGTAVLGSALAAYLIWTLP
ncbi:MAG TPA: fumarate reductase subunit FrdD [Terriglobales bacterium]|nr:fumarate reductase subunit FrdD [Terriglobales bacterium]